MAHTFPTIFLFLKTMNTCSNNTKCQLHLNKQNSYADRTVKRTTLTMCIQYLFYDVGNNYNLGVKGKECLSISKIFNK